MKTEWSIGQFEWFIYDAYLVTDCEYFTVTPVRGDYGQISHYAITVDTASNTKELFLDLLDEWTSLPTLLWCDRVELKALKTKLQALEPIKDTA